MDSTGVNADGGILAQITAALDLIYNPQSTNQSRQEAQAFLENVKTLEEAPQHGYTLASNKALSPMLRHYGLSLLEHAVKYRWADYNQEQASYLRNWILQLSQDVSRDDPSYLRSKIAQLWVELAGRCWADDWMDMDELLVRMWQVDNSVVHKELVLQILETLSVEIFEGDNPVFQIRETELSKACVEIFTPASVLTDTFPNRKEGPVVRCGDEGWLSRIGQLLDTCLNGDVQNNEDIRACAIRSLMVYYSVMSWAIPKAIIATQCVGHMCRGLAAAHVSVQKQALEGLHALYSRSSFTSDEFKDLVVPMYEAEFVDLAVKLFEWCTVDANDIDEDKYTFAKKFSEMISCLGQYLPRRYSFIPPGVNIQGFLELLFLVVQSPSLVVSIPVLVTWTKLLGHKTIGPLIGNTAMVGPLLEVCSSRLIRYENLPEDTEDPTLLLLLEDTDTIPERHAFLGNYRRFSSQVIESIVQLKLKDAFYHILSQAENVLNTLYDGQPRLDMANYSKNSMPFLRVDAHFTVIESALKGYTRCKRGETGRQDTGQGSNPAQDLQVQAALESDFEQWCNRLLEMELQDPMIRKRRLSLLVAFSTSALDKNADFMLKVLGHILTTWPAAVPEHKAFNEAIRDLQSESTIELQRLAGKMPDHLLDVYGQLEAKIQEMIASGSLDEKRQVAYQTFLFTVTHRAQQLDQATRIKRLRAFVEPVQMQWANDNLRQALASYPAFCDLICLDKAQQYLATRRVHEIRDWGSVELDDEGRALQKEMDGRQAMLPLRPTKAFLMHSVEKVERGSPPYEASVAIWQNALPVILPEILKFLGHAHAAHNPANWTILGPEMQPVVSAVLTDRFWQAGISEGSRDEFYARVLDKKNTLEGLASSIRGSVRFVREVCYSILYCMSRLDEHFYGIPNISEYLAKAMFTDSFSLSTHQVINLLNLVRYLVDHCPTELREQFLPRVLGDCFREMDRKITGEWEKLAARAGVQAEGDALTEEMKAESILRQLTYTAVLLIADLLDPARANPAPSPANQDRAAKPAPSLRRFCLMNMEIAEPMLLFCSHAIAMRDTRQVGMTLRVFKSIVPEFCADENGLDTAYEAVPGRSGPDDLFKMPVETSRSIREFISSQVLTACINSLQHPYFVDSQKDIASLIASIIHDYAPRTETPKNVLASLQGVNWVEVQQMMDQICSPEYISSRNHRGLVLKFFQNSKGVSVSEMGKLTSSVAINGAKTAAKRSKMAQEFMTAAPAEDTKGGRQKTPDLAGVADMFNLDNN